MVRSGELEHAIEGGPSAAGDIIRDFDGGLEVFERPEDLFGGDESHIRAVGDGASGEEVLSRGLLSEAMEDT